jgi:hypothetical protein
MQTAKAAKGYSRQEIVDMANIYQDAFGETMKEKKG